MALMSKVVAPTMDTAKTVVGACGDPLVDGRPLKVYAGEAMVHCGICQLKHSQQNVGEMHADGR